MAGREETFNSYQIKPKLEKRFRQLSVKECIHNVLNAELVGKTYSSSDAGQWTKQISAQIKDNLKSFGYDRYKFVVQVIIGEQRGEGVTYDKDFQKLLAGSRCLWDSATDNYASDIYLSETFFCLASAYGVYYY